METWRLRAVGFGSGCWLVATGEETAGWEDGGYVSRSAYCSQKDGMLEVQQM